MNARFLVPLVLVLVGCAPVTPTVSPAVATKAPASYASLTAALTERQDLSEFRKLAQQVGLLEDLENAGAVTLLVPNNLAIEAHQPAYLQKLANDRPQLRHLLAGHVIRERLTAEELLQRKKVHAEIQPERDGLSHYDVELEDGQVMVDNVKIEEKDIVAGDSLIHVVDSVLHPHFDPHKERDPRKPELWALPARYRN